MELLTASSFDTASVITNLGFAGAAVLGVNVVQYGWRKINGFFGR